MNTKCFCIFCKHHPLHENKKDFKDWLTGWEPGSLSYTKYKSQGKDVNCLQPVSDAFDNLGRNPSDFEYPITAYGDGLAETGVSEVSFTIFAICENEQHSEE